MKHHSVESVCVFGSAARSSADVISDRDVLVVADDKGTRRRLMQRWRDAGWSVACYAPGRFLNMIGAGSLFVQHIKLEGIIVRDENGWLAKVLQSAERRQTYETEALRSVALAVPIERFPSGALIHQVPIVSDLAYVSLRNFGICHLADGGETVFDYSRIVERLTEEFGLCPEETRLARSLRASKAAYRAGVGGSFNHGTVEELRCLLSKFFQHRPLEGIPGSTPVRELESGYATLRDFEAAVVRMVEAPRLREKGGLRGLERVLKMIKDPRTYAWDVRNVSSCELEALRRRVECSLEAPTSCDLQHGHLGGRGGWPGLVAPEW